MAKATQKSVSTGLVLGKFAPFHKGHEYLVRTALMTCDIVYILVYDSRDVIDIPLNIRADWIRKIFSEFHNRLVVIEGWGSPSDEGHNPATMKLQERYIQSVIPEKITHFFSSEWYGEHVSDALQAKNIVVDLDRTTIPCSGRIIRSNPHKHQNLLDRFVYKDFVKKVVFLGAESTGKTTLTRSLAKIYDTSYMEEYGREYWIENKDKEGKLTPSQLVDLARRHKKLEDQKLLNAKRYLFVDTNAVTTYMFGQYYHKKVDQELERLARLAQREYHEWFLCDTDIPYIEDGTRSGAKHRAVFQRKIIKDLNERGIKYHLISGNLKERIAKVHEYLK